MRAIPPIKYAAEFKEQQHPRDEGGQFTSGGGGGGAQPEKKSSTFATGRPVSVKVYRGMSRGGGGLSAQGIGTYYGLEPEVAQSFSHEGTVKSANVTLSNPVVARNDAELKAIKQAAEEATGEDLGKKGNLYAGWLLPKAASSSPSGRGQDEVFTDYLVSQGHDGIIVDFKEAAGGRQLVVFPAQEKKSPTSSPGDWLMNYSKWDESDHPRDDDGKFGSGGGGQTKQSDPIKAAGFTPDSRQEWRKKNKVSQRQKRTSQVQDAADSLRSGEISQGEYLETVKEHRPITPLAEVPEIPSFKDIVGALNENKIQTGIVGLTPVTMPDGSGELKDGDKVAARLDIPAYDDYDTWVVSLHDGSKKGGKSIGYAQTAVLDNVEFSTSAKAAINIGVEKPKTTFARMHGEWKSHSPQDARARAITYMDHPDWKQIGMNPFRHSWFYDKDDSRPVVGAEQVIQIGALVLAKNVKYAPVDDDQFAFTNEKGETSHYAKWEESEHPRDDDGKFGEGGGRPQPSQLFTADERRHHMAEKMLAGHSNWSEAAKNVRHRAATKTQAAKSIAAKLEGNPVWENFAMLFRAQRVEGSFRLGDVGKNETTGEAVALRLITMWGQTSGDTDLLPLALQEAASREFGLRRTSGSYGEARDVEFHKHTVAEARKHKHVEAMQLFLRAQYEVTQEELRRQGVGPDDTVMVYRGLNFRRLPKSLAGHGKGEPFQPVNNFSANPMSSFSVNEDAARVFTEDDRYGVMMRVEVPAKDILGTPSTGYGCIPEGEIVVLSRPNTSAVASVVEHGTEDYSRYEMGGEPVEPFNIDEFLHNADWPKRTDDTMEGLGLANNGDQEKFSKWEESDHPRDESGRFGEGGGTGEQPSLPGMESAEFVAKPVAFDTTTWDDPEIGSDGYIVEGTVGEFPITTKERGLIEKVTKKTQAALSDALSDPGVAEAMRRGGITNFRIEPHRGPNKPKKWTAGYASGVLLIHTRSAESLEGWESGRRHGMKRTIVHESGHGLWNRSSDELKDKFQEAVTKDQDTLDYVSGVVNVKADPNAMFDIGSRLITEAFAEIVAMQQYDPDRYAQLSEDIREPIAEMERRSDARNKRFPPGWKLPKTKPGTQKPFSVQDMSDFWKYAKFDESKHPRDEGGRFGEGGGGADKPAGKPKMQTKEEKKSDWKPSMTEQDALAWSKDTHPDFQRWFHHASTVDPEQLKREGFKNESVLEKTSGLNLFGVGTYLASGSPGELATYGEPLRVRINVKKPLNRKNREEVAKLVASDEFEAATDALGAMTEQARYHRALQFAAMQHGYDAMYTVDDEGEVWPVIFDKKNMAISDNRNPAHKDFDSPNYTAVKFDDESRQKLLDALKAHDLPPEGWEIDAHHMTMHSGPAEAGESGGEDMRLTGIMVSDKIIVGRIKGGPHSQFPRHVTLAVNRAEGGSAGDAGKLVATAGKSEHAWRPPLGPGFKSYKEGEPIEVPLSGEIGTLDKDDTGWRIKPGQEPENYSMLTEKGHKASLYEEKISQYAAKREQKEWYKLAFKEAEHKRDESGQFTSGGGGRAPSELQAARKEAGRPTEPGVAHPTPHPPEKPGTNSVEAAKEKWPLSKPVRSDQLGPIMFYPVTEWPSGSTIPGSTGGNPGRPLAHGEAPRWLLTPPITTVEMEKHGGRVKSIEMRKQMGRPPSFDKDGVPYWSGPMHPAANAQRMRVRSGAAGYSRLSQMFEAEYYARQMTLWEESDHPRDADGKFGSGTGGKKATEEKKSKAVAPFEFTIRNEGKWIYDPKDKPTGSWAAPQTMIDYDPSEVTLDELQSLVRRGHFPVTNKETGDRAWFFSYSNGYRLVRNDAFEDKPVWHDRIASGKSNPLIAAVKSRRSEKDRGRKFTESDASVARTKVMNSLDDSLKTMMTEDGWRPDKEAATKYTAKQMEAHFPKILDAWGTKAISLIGEIKEVVIHADKERLNLEANNESGTVQGFYRYTHNVPGSGELHLTASGIDDTEREEAVIAHEMTHALDGVTHVYSSTRKWKNAWRKEIGSQKKIGWVLSEDESGKLQAYAGTEARDLKVGDKVDDNWSGGTQESGGRLRYKEIKSVSESRVFGGKSIHITFHDREDGTTPEEIYAKPRGRIRLDTSERTPDSPLSRYATTAASEGFAEFGRQIVEDKVHAKEFFPKCYKLWQEWGLVDD